MSKILSFFLIFFIFLISCNDSNLPKQSAFLRIEFPEPNYLFHNELNLPTDFYYNSNAAMIGLANDSQLSIDYSNMNLSIDLSFNNLNNQQRLENNLRDFLLILDTHSKKSNGVVMREYEDKNKRKFGKIFEMKGDVASPIQFYITDSLSNFMKGSLNLKFKSKYDSIFPSIQYVKNDIIVLFESLNWRSK